MPGAPISSWSELNDVFDVLKTHTIHFNFDELSSSFRDTIISLDNNGDIIQKKTFVYGNRTYLVCYKLDDYNVDEVEITLD